MRSVDDKADIYEQRRYELKRICINNGFQAAMIDSPENLRYYTGFTGGEAMFIIMPDDNVSNNRGKDGITVSGKNDNNNSNNKNNVNNDNDINSNNNKMVILNENIQKAIREKGMCIITDSRYYEQVEKESPDVPLVRLDNKTYIEVICAVLSYYNTDNIINEMNSCNLNGNDCYVNHDDNSIITVAIEDSMKLSRYLKLKDTLKGCDLIVAGEKLNKPRMVKDDTELSLIKRAETIGDEAFTYILSIIKPGMTEREIAIELEFFMKRKGASKLSFDTIVASGRNSSMPHAQVTDKVIENGDFVTMDFGCVYEGYCSDMTRTIAVGKPTDEMEKVYQIVLDANLFALEGIKAGVKCSDIDALARDHIRNEGYGEYFGHGLGHSVGLYIHEEPRFSPKCDTITEKNMVITDEPGIYLPGKFGVRIEDLVVVKEDGYELLSHSPKKLIVI